jgi:RNA polymerase sigma-70 factor (ECF subfamily)
VRDPETAEDLTQDVFLMMYRDREQLRQPDRIVSWIMRIAHSVGYSSLRKSRRRQTASLDDESGYYAETLADESAADPASGLQSGAQAILLGPALEALRDKERDIVWMTYFLDLKQREIADTLDIPIGSVGTTLKRALEKLRTHFEAQGLSPEDLW